MARPNDPSSPAEPLPGLKSKLFLARLTLAWEALWPALWPAVGIGGLFLAFALLDILPSLPGWLHALLLAGFAITFLGGLVRAGRRFIMPAPHDGKRRLEQASGLDHRPLTAIDDSLASGRDDAATSDLWHLHQRRMADAAEHLRVGTPSPGLARHDPRALRIVLAVLLVFAVVAGWSDPVQRIARAVTPTLQQQTNAPEMVLDLWITPPDYTGLPPLFPLRITQQTAANKDKLPATAEKQSAENQSDDVNQQGEKEAGKPDSTEVLTALTIPAGSILTAQIQGAGEQPKLVLGKDETLFESVDPSYSKIIQKITKDGRLTIVAGDRTLGSWQVTLLEDQKPAIAFSNPPVGTPQATLRVSYTASDDYGVAKAHAEIRRTYERGSVTGKEVHRVELPLPGRAARTINETSFFDLAPHKWAGQPVIIELVVKDALNQTNKSELVRMVLPERTFVHPVARAIIEQRKRLANQPEQRRTVLHGLSEIASNPKAFGQDVVVYLSLITTRSRLAYDSSDSVIEPVINLLWDTALRLEDGKLSIAERELGRIQQALMKALAEGASDAKLEQLMRELQRAIARYMAALQEQMRRNPNAQQAVEFDPSTMRMIQGSDIQRMLDQIRKLMQSGARQAAREMLARLQRMLSGMRSMQVMRRGSRGGQRNSALRRLQDLIRQQQQLMDQTFRSARPGSGQQRGQMPSAADQKALQSLLKQLRGMMRGAKPGQGPGQALGRANGAMDRAIRSLEGNRPGDAVGAQGNALDQLRRAGRTMLQQMMERFARQSGNRPNQQGRPNQPRRDPLGRESLGDENDEFGVKIPNASAVQRAREILDELRRRSGQISRQPSELDYINRLLQRF